MRGDALINVVVAGVLDQVADVVGCTRAPVAPVGTDDFNCLGITAGIKTQNFAGSHTAARQDHIDRGRISLWRLQCPGYSFRILLGVDGLLVELIIQRVGKEVAARGEVG